MWQALKHKGIKKSINRAEIIIIIIVMDLLQLVPGPSRHEVNTPVSLDGSILAVDSIENHTATNELKKLSVVCK